MVSDQNFSARSRSCDPTASQAGVAFQGVPLRSTQRKQNIAAIPPESFSLALDLPETRRIKGFEAQIL